MLSPSRETAWRLSLAAGLVPLLVVGFTVSVIANRLVFIGWALAWAAAHCAVLWHGFAADWSAARRLAAALAVMTGAAATFGVLAAGHHEIFDLGFRAMLPQIYHPRVTQPATAYGLATLLAIAALAVAVQTISAGTRRQRSRRQS